MSKVVHHAESGLPQAVCGVLRYPDDSLVAASRRHQDTLGMPGGKHDEGETAEQALVRETDEECGLVLNPDDLRFLYAGICPPERPGGQAYWCITYLVDLREDQVPREVEPGIVPVRVRWAELLARGAFQDYDRRVYEAFLARQRAITGV